MKYTIGNEKLQIEADSLGAELVSVRFAGKERVWQNENGSWAGHAPVLFPVCGHFGVTVGGIRYPIRAHGFAKRSEFELNGAGGDYLSFRLASSPETKRVYPYDFELTVRYTLRGNELITEYEVKNSGKTPLYFACGGHPSFALGGSVEGYAVEFSEEERFLNRVHNDDGYLTGEVQDLGTGKTLSLKEEYFANEYTLIFADTRSKFVALKSPRGETVATLAFGGFSNLLLWEPQGAEMICIEPWTNLPDLAGAEDSEFSKKAGVTEVAVGKRATFAFTIAYF